MDASGRAEVPGFPSFPSGETQNSTADPDNGKAIKDISAMDVIVRIAKVFTDQ